MRSCERVNDPLGWFYKGKGGSFLDQLSEY
jgi:hypothetical protein